ncbi:MAG: hypothetical protein V5A56_00340 [Halolamina sp.]
MVGPEIDISKRTLLTVTGISFLGAAGASQALTQPVSYNRQNIVDGEGLGLRVGWKEWYNGAVQENRAAGGSGPADSSPVVTLSNLFPGDSGRLAFGLTTHADTGSPPPARLQTRVRTLPISDTENGIIEPEAAAGDSSLNSGELQDSLELLLWYDTGASVGDAPLFGHCDGSFDASVDTELSRGSFSAIAVPATSDAWVEVDPHPNESSDCLRRDEALCLGVSWQLPTDAGNHLQTDRLAFAIEFRAVQCQQP